MVTITICDCNFTMSPGTAAIGGASLDDSGNCVVCKTPLKMYGAVEPNLNVKDHGILVVDATVVPLRLRKVSSEQGVVWTPEVPNVGKALTNVLRKLAGRRQN